MSAPAAFPPAVRWLWGLPHTTTFSPNRCRSPGTLLPYPPARCNDAEKARMQALNERDVSIDYAFMVTVEKFMRHGCKNVPDYMLSGSRGDFTGVGDIHFFYSADEVLYGALPDFEEACKRANVPYTAFARPKMVHCYCMLPIFQEAKEDFAKIVDFLKK